MEYINIVDQLAQEGCKAGALNLLTPNKADASVAMLQCQGQILASAEGISASGDPAFLGKLEGFISYIYASQPDIAMTPEYSMSWSVVEALVKNETYPSEGKIWVFGCESIKPSELSELVKQESQICWVIDEQAYAQTENVFLDPLICVFPVVGNMGEPRIAIVVQFKAVPMGGDFESRVEAANLIGGTCRYYYKAPGSIALLPIICSDAFDFNYEDLYEYNFYSYLILHLQMTPKPFDPAFCQYRDIIFKSGSGEKYEFLTLNWASNTTINGAELSSEFGGSAYYMKPLGFDKEEANGKHYREPHQSDSKIEANHAKGLYLKFCQSRRMAAYYLMGSEHIHVSQISKVDQSLASPAQRHRAGASSIRVMTWDAGAGWVGANDVLDDGISILSASFPESVREIIDIRPVARERLVAISVANISNKKWHFIRQLAGFNISQAEESPGGLAVSIRASQRAEIDSTLSKLCSLTVEILPCLSKHQIPFSDLVRDDLKLELNISENGVSNVTDGGADANAVICYAGGASPEFAQAAYDNMKKNLSVDRVLVFYRFAGDIHLKSDVLRLINDDEIMPDDISRVGE
jgi:hypothetical protein